MHRPCWKSGWMTVLFVTGLTAMSLAQDMPAAARAAKNSRGAFGFAATLERKVGLTPEQRQKSQALREETDRKIRAVLNPEQQQKFDEVLAEQKSRFSRKNKGA